jgi:putative DNA primase/helicase
MPEVEYYQLSDGQVIEDEMMSEMMYRIMKLRPHVSFTYSWDDIGMATLMSDIYSDSIRYCPQNDCWYIWDKCWQKQGESGAISDMLQTLLNLLLLYCSEIYHEVSWDEKAKDLIEKYRKYISSIRKYTPMRNIMEVLKTMVRMSLKDIDSNPYLLNTTTHAYDLRTGEIIQDITPYNITKKTTCSLPNAFTKRCDRWYQFIDEITGGNKDKAQFLQRALGYSILGVNREECMFIAYGAKTRNGKGTLFSTINTVLGEDYADSAPPDLICENKSGRTTDFNAPQPALAKLVGTRLVRMSESARDVRLDAASMKTMTGRDTLVTRGLFQNSFSFVPQFTLWLETNHLPAVTDDTVFTSNRIYVIEFNEQFTEGKQDKNLKELFALPENRPTILQWLFDGCTDYIKNGLAAPECITEATKNYRKLHDRIGNFIEEVCEVGADKKIIRGSLYSAYSQWCIKPDNRYKPMGSTTFYNEVATRGYPIKRRTEGTYVMGIDIVDDTDDGKIKLT